MIVYSFLSSCKADSTLPVDIGSSPDVGSSSKMISGCSARERARHRRCCCPPDRAMAGSSSRSLTSSHNAASFRLRSTASSSLDLRFSPASSNPYVRFSRMDIGNTTGLAKTIPTLRRNAITSVCGSRTFSPSMRMRPEEAFTSVRSFNRFKHRNNVDLPPPAGPKRTVTAFSRIPRLMLRRDSVPSEYCSERFSMTILSTIAVLPLPSNVSQLLRDSSSAQKPIRRVLFHIGFESAFQGLVLKLQTDDKAKPWLHRKVKSGDEAGRMLHL